MREEDVDELVVLDNDPDVMRYLTGGKPRTRAEVADDYRARLDEGEYWMAFERTSGDCIGWFGLDGDEAPKPATLELGYRLHRKAWGAGYGTEGSSALLDVAFEQRDAERVIAHTMAVNTRSRRLMERIGMRYVRTFHQEFDDPLPGTELGEVEYEIGRDEWLRTRLSRT